jgi:hypothetical protein
MENDNSSSSNENCEYDSDYESEIDEDFEVPLDKENNVIEPSGNPKDGQCYWCGYYTRGKINGKKIFCYRLHRIHDTVDDEEYCSVNCVFAAIDSTGGNSIGRRIVNAKIYKTSKDLKAAGDWRDLKRFDGSITYEEYRKDFYTPSLN